MSKFTDEQRKAAGAAQVVLDQRVEMIEEDLKFELQMRFGLSNDEADDLWEEAL